MFRPLWKFWSYSSTSNKRNVCCGLDCDLVNCLILCESKGFTKCSVWFWTTFWTCSKNILQWSIQHSLDSYNCGKHKDYDLLITSFHEFLILNSEFSRVFLANHLLGFFTSKLCNWLVIREYWGFGNSELVKIVMSSSIVYWFF